jgi:hypothetical protein
MCSIILTLTQTNMKPFSAIQLISKSLTALALTMMCLTFATPVMGQTGKAGAPKGAVVTVIIQSYTYPTALSANGDYVAGMPFGGSASYYWSGSTGMVQVPGTAYGVADNGIVGGSYPNSSVQYNGSDVETAGTWNPTTNQWTFLGMNPVVPQLFSTDYNVGWDITSDGSTLVGMQWYANYDYSAFKWTQANGYEMIGSGVGNGSRASGISANGSVVFGWAEVSAASRTPVIWYNGQAYFVNNTQYGEAYGASTTGNYVTGEINNAGFLWTPQGTTLFSNTLNTQVMSPTTVLNDGTVFGYTHPAWPPLPTSRRAFVRDLQGNMSTFNDYAASRGLEDAQSWTFYSINDASADGNKFIGAGINPLGQDVTFIIAFQSGLPVCSIAPSSVSFGEILTGTQSGFQNVEITNTGTADLIINSLSLSGSSPQSFVLNDTHTYPLTIGPQQSAVVSVAFAPLAIGLQQAEIFLTTNAGDYHVPLSGTGVDGVGIAKTPGTTLNVFPNPASSSVTITCPGKMQKVQFYNSVGQMVMVQPVNGLTQATIDVTSLTSGYYLIRLTGMDGFVENTSVVIRK